MNISINIFYFILLFLIKNKRNINNKSFFIKTSKKNTIKYIKKIYNLSNNLNFQFYKLKRIFKFNNPNLKKNKLYQINKDENEEKYEIVKNLKKYCQDTKKYKRLNTREVKIGNVKIGGNNRIAIQTMTSCDTRNVDECVSQILKCKELGADMIRLTVQGVQEAEASFHIKDKLLSKNCNIPLIADIHFNPKIALMAADVYDKIRINPGNYVDGRKKWTNKKYDEKEFEERKKIIEEKFIQLVEKCKLLKKAIRIGTNHGSLSERILSYYGDTPLGMVKSALEFSDICIQNNFYNIVFSMKASNAYVMIQSYRLLVNQYLNNNLINFPIHLGVTEAGFGNNGRIKSYLGIGSLLYDGIGDTIRISLTEDPWNELNPCKQIINTLKKRIFFNENNMDLNKNNINNLNNILNFEENYRDFNNIQQLIDTKNNNILHEQCSIGNFVNINELNNLQIFKDLNLEIDKEGELIKGFKTSDFIILNDENNIESVSKIINRIMKAGLYVLIKYKKENINFIENKLKYNNIIIYNDIISMINILEKEKKIDLNNIKGYALILNGKENVETIKKLKYLNPKPLFILLKSDNIYEHVLVTRRLNEYLNLYNIKIPYIHYVDIHSTNFDDILAEVSLFTGTCLIDLMGNGLIINVNNLQKYTDEYKTRVGLNSFLTLNILQDTRIRLFKTDYIACPSCGRTLFNIQETTKKIMKLTSHLKGVKIAVMGCIVNGIGEMADAHFGYVGSAPKKIDLYVGKELVERNIPEEEACDKLIELIKKHNKWIDPPN